MHSITLFHLKRPDIAITMWLYFNEVGQLCFEGYDTGETVENMWGDYDYEYNYTIEPAEVNKLYTVLNITMGDKSALLQALKERFGCNEAYTMLGKFMAENDINYEGFTWA